MVWTVNGSLCHRFLKWKIKCKNMLNCELAMLSETRKCKKSYDLVRWLWNWPGGNPGACPQKNYAWRWFGINFEEFCKPQTNEVRARFDFLSSFRQGDMSVDEWYNAVQAHINVAKYPTETAKILHRDIFWSFLRDEKIVYKTFNDSNIYLEKFPASHVRQLAKRLESSKSTASHIRKMSSEPQAPQVNLLRHPKNRNTTKQSYRENARITKLDPMKPTINKHHTRKMSLKTRRNLIPGRFLRVKTDVTNMVIPNI